MYFRYNGIVAMEMLKWQYLGGENSTEEDKTEEASRRRSSNVVVDSIVNVGVTNVKVTSVRVTYVTNVTLANVGVTYVYNVRVNVSKANIVHHSDQGPARPLQPNSVILYDLEASTRFGFLLTQKSLSNDVGTLSRPGNYWTPLVAVSRPKKKIGRCSRWDLPQ